MTDEGNNYYEEIECILCTEGKMCQIRNKSPDEKAKAPLDFVHCDLAGPIDPTGRDGFKYALSFVDDFSGIIMVYFLKSKGDAPEALEQLLADCAPFGNLCHVKLVCPLQVELHPLMKVVEVQVALKWETIPHTSHQDTPFKQELSQNI